MLLPNGLVANIVNGSLPGQQEKVAECYQILEDAGVDVPSAKTLNNLPDTLRNYFDVEIVLSDNVRQHIYNEGYSLNIANEIWIGLNRYVSQHSGLTEFVENDPDLYCSLPISASSETLRYVPTRYVRGGYTNSCNTGIIPTTTLQIYSKFRVSYVAEYYPAFQQKYISESAATTRAICLNSSPSVLAFNLCRVSGGGGAGVTFPYAVAGRWITIDMNHDRVIANGIENAMSGADGTINKNPIYLFGRGDTYGMTDIDFCEFTTIDGEFIQQLLPILHNGVAKFIDIKSLSLFAPPSGTWQIGKEYPTIS